MAKITYNTTKWHSTTGVGSYVDDAPSSKRRFVPSAAKIRQMAKASKSGGRGTCEVCRETFTMEYIRLVRFANFHTGFACLDCKKGRDLQPV